MALHRSVFWSNRRAGTALTAAIGVAVAIPAVASGHGATQSPASRTLQCRDDRSSEMCARAWRANAQALYDWMEVNIGEARGRHRKLIPNGKLCGAGRSKYRAFNTPGQWKATRMSPNARGRYEVRFTATAPHATAYWRWYITKDRFDPTRDRLGWDELVLVKETRRERAKAHPKFELDLGERSGHHILYMVWQRSDSPEAFYGCSDVDLRPDLAPTGTPTPPAGTHPAVVLRPPKGRIVQLRLRGADFGHRLGHRTPGAHVLAQRQIVVRRLPLVVPVGHGWMRPDRRVQWRLLPATGSGSEPGPWRTIGVSLVRSEEVSPER